MLSPYRIHPNNANKRVRMGKITNFDNNSDRVSDIKKTQMTSNDLKGNQLTSNESGKKVKSKNNLKGGFIQENVEINDQ